MMFSNTRTIIVELIKATLMICFVGGLMFICYYILFQFTNDSQYVRNLSYVTVFLIAVCIIYCMGKVVAMYSFAFGIIKDKRSVRHMCRGKMLYITFVNKAFGSRYKIFMIDDRGHEKEFYCEKKIYTDIHTVIHVMYGHNSNYVFKIVDEAKIPKKDYFMFE